MFTLMSKPLQTLSPLPVDEVFLGRGDLEFSRGENILPFHFPGMGLREANAAQPSRKKKKKKRRRRREERRKTNKQGKVK